MKFAKSTALTLTLLLCCSIVVFAIYLTLKFVEKQKVVQLESTKNYSGYQIIKVIPRSVYDIRILNEMRHKHKLTFWNNAVKVNISVLIQVPPTKQTEVCRLLQEKLVPFVIAIFDLQEAIDKQYGEHIHKHIEDFSEFDFNSYHTLEEIIEYLILLQRHKEASVIVIGNSTEKRNIVVVRILNKEHTVARNTVFIECGIHAREWISPATCLFIINQLLTNSSLAKLRVKFDFYLLPVMNPDGYEYTWTHDRLWRKTRTKVKISNSSDQYCYGVDLNRNFRVHLESNVKTKINPCQEIYAGNEPFSEPESQALRDFLFHIKRNSESNLTVYISLHSYGQQWTFPYAYKKEEPRNKDQMELLSKLGVSTIRSFHNGNWTYGSASKAIYIASGVTTDWVYDAIGFEYCFAIEMRDRGQNGFVLPTEQINAAVTETWAGINAVLSYLIDSQ